MPETTCPACLEKCYGWILKWAPVIDCPYCGAPLKTAERKLPA